MYGLGSRLCPFFALDRNSFFFFFWPLAETPDFSWLQFPVSNSFQDFFSFLGCGECFFLHLRAIADLEFTYY